MRQDRLAAPGDRLYNAKTVAQRETHRSPPAFRLQRGRTESWVRRAWIIVPQFVETGHIALDRLAAPIRAWHKPGSAVLHTPPLRRVPTQTDTPGLAGAPLSFVQLHLVPGVGRLP